MRKIEATTIMQVNEDAALSDDILEYLRLAKELDATEVKMDAIKSRLKKQFRSTLDEDKTDLAITVTTDVGLKFSLVETENKRLAGARLLEEKPEIHAAYCGAPFKTLTLSISGLNKKKKA